MKRCRNTLAEHEHVSTLCSPSTLQHLRRKQTLLHYHGPDASYWDILPNEIKLLILKHSWPNVKTPPPSNNMQIIYLGYRRYQLSRLMDSLFTSFVQLPGVGPCIDFAYSDAWLLAFVRLPGVGPCIDFAYHCYDILTLTWIQPPSNHTLMATPRVIFAPFQNKNGNHPCPTKTRWTATTKSNPTIAFVFFSKTNHVLALHKNFVFN